MKKRFLIYFITLFIINCMITNITGSRYVSEFSKTINLAIVEPVYNVRFNSNGGTGSMDNQQFTYGETKNLTQNSFSKYGHTFSSWNTLSNGSGTSYNDAQSVSNLVSINNGYYDLYAIYENIRNIRISDVSVNTTSGASSSNIAYTYNTITDNVTLSNSNSYVTYEIDVSNYLNQDMGILSITGLNSNLDYEIVSNYSLKTKLVDASNASGEVGNTSTILLKIKYKSGYYNSNNTSYSLNLNFDFKPVHKITYSNIAMGSYPSSIITSTMIANNYPIDITSIKYPSEIMEGDTLQIEFYPNIPTQLEVSNTVNYTYNKPMLTLTNATDDITINSLTSGEWVVYDKPSTTNFNGSNYINTQVQLFNSENASKDFKLSFEINSVNSKTGLSTIMNAMNESGSPWPGLMLRINDTNTNEFNTQANTVANKGQSRYYNIGSVTKFEYTRENKIMYISTDNGARQQFNDYSSVASFNTPVTFGASLDGSNNPWRYFNGSLSNMKITWLDTGGANPQQDTMQYVYQKTEATTFNGSNSINTGVYLFSSENIDKDFEIGLTIESLGDASSNTSNKSTLVSSFYEVNPYDGFALRYEKSNDNPALKVCANGDKGYEYLSIFSSGTRFKLIRRDKILYYQINDEPEQQLYDYTDFNTVLNVPITFGGALDSSGNAFRGLTGTLSNMYIKLEK